MTECEGFEPDHTYWRTFVTRPHVGQRVSVMTDLPTGAFNIMEGTYLGTGRIDDSELLHTLTEVYFPHNGSRLDWVGWPVTLTKEGAFLP